MFEGADISVIMPLLRRSDVDRFVLAESRGERRLSGEWRWLELSDELGAEEAGISCTSVVMYNLPLFSSQIVGQPVGTLLASLRPFGVVALSRGEARFALNRGILGALKTATYCGESSFSPLVRIGVTKKGLV